MAADADRFVQTLRQLRQMARGQRQVLHRMQCPLADAILIKPMPILMKNVRVPGIYVGIRRLLSHRPQQL